MIKRYPARLDAEQVPSSSLIADRNIAQPDRPVTVIQEGARDDAHRIREIDDPGVIGGEPGDPLGDLQDHRHGTECLRQPPSTGRLLADTATLQRQAFIDRARRLATNPQLEQNHCGICHRPIKISCERDVPGIAVSGENALRDPGDQGEPLLSRVGQHQLVNPKQMLQPRDPVGQLGCVSGASAYHGDLHQSLPIKVVD